MNRTRPVTNRPRGLRLPLPEWIRDYRREWITLDAIAGLTTALSG